MYEFTRLEQEVVLEVLNEIRAHNRTGLSHRRYILSGN